MWKDSVTEGVNKFTRICYNSNNWMGPVKTIRNGSENLFETQNGFAFDEWLADSKRFYNEFDGYCYSFIRSYMSKELVGVKHSVLLITKRHDGVWLASGKIYMVEGLDNNDATEALHQLSWQTDFYETLCKEIIQADANVDVFNHYFNTTPRAVLNVRFKPTDAVWFSQPLEIPTNLLRGRYRYSKLYDVDF